MTLLERTESTLPAGWYHDPGQYARELRQVWYRDWICVGRREDLPPSGDELVAEIGTQHCVVTRDSRDRLAARAIDSDPARRIRDVHVDTWGGFLFVNLSAAPPDSLRAFLGEEAQALENWPLERLVPAHREKKTLACNWKVFWENYSECYHCPGLHPELCRVVPLYRKGVLSHADVPGWEPADENDDGRPTVGPGMGTWTLDGKSTLPAIGGLDERSRSDGMAFASFTASMFLVGHPDYVRSVRVLPKGPESVELTIDWLLEPGVREADIAGFEHILELGRLVIDQDGYACELNQRGLRSRGHRQGVLVPHEYELWMFHQWLRRRCAATA